MYSIQEVTYVYMYIFKYYKGQEARRPVEAQGHKHATVNETGCEFDSPLKEINEAYGELITALSGGA